MNMSIGMLAHEASILVVILNGIGFLDINLESSSDGFIVVD